MLTGDHHTDHQYCDHKLLKKHLDKARERDAPIISVGDFFCAMQAPSDKRASKKALTDELSRRDDYFNGLIEEAMRRHGPYADLYALMAEGNHHTSVTKRNGLDLLGWFTEGINAELRAQNHPHRMRRTGYGGWLICQFQVGKTERYATTMRLYHGSGGDAPVNKGLIEVNRQLVMLDGVDILVNGHNHQAYHVSQSVERLDLHHRVRHKIIDAVRTATYKDEWRASQGGFAVEKNLGPRPLGCCWVRFYSQSGGGIGREFVLDIERDRLIG